MSKTLEVEQITEQSRMLAGLARSYNLTAECAAIVDTAKAGARLASLCRGAIKVCDEQNDPTERVKTMLTQFLLIAGFDE